MAIDRPGEPDDPKSKVKWMSTKQGIDLTETLNYDRSRGEKEKNVERSENFEVPQNLRRFRELWKRKVTRINRKIKDKMVEKLERIPVNVETLEDGSRLIEIRFKTRVYKILDPKLYNHSDDEYRFREYYKSIGSLNRDEIKLGGMWSDDENNWENQKLKEFVEQMKLLGLHIPKIEEMKILLRRLFVILDLPRINDEKKRMEEAIAALMYLTGINGGYWLSMGDSESSEVKYARSTLDTYGLGHVIVGTPYTNDLCASLLMLSWKDNIRG